MPNKRLHIERADELVRLHVAEPAPLGLFGLSVGCLILMCVDFGITYGKLMLIPWIFLLPAGLQLIAGIIDFLRHNVFGGTAFIGYSVFWFGLSCVYLFEIEYNNNESIDELLPPKPIIRQHTAIVCIAYLIFSIILTIISLGVNRILLSILAAIDIAFFVLILHSFMHEIVPSWIVGIALLLVFMSSMYGFIAILLLKVAGGEVLPIGAPYIKWVDYVITDSSHSKQKIQKINKDKVFEKIDNANSSPSTSISQINMQKHKYNTYYTQVTMEPNGDAIAVTTETNDNNV